MRRLAITTIVSIFALPVAAAQAGFFPSVAVDGGAITETRDVDLAPDGAGAITFVRVDDGVPHAYVNRFVAGRFVGAERVDGGLEGGSSQVSVAAGNGGRLAVAFRSGGMLYGNVRPNAGAAWTGPMPIATGGADPVLDMSVHGVGFLAYRVGGDLFASYVPRTDNAFLPAGGPLDFNAAQDAGLGDGRPRIAASAAGSAVVVWGEKGLDGLQHVYARRVLQGSISTAPQEASATSFEGRPAGDAGLPDVAIEDDESFAWVALRQAFIEDGTPRTRIIVRHLRGATFEGPISVDTVGWGGGVGEPRMTMNPRGEGFATFATDGGSQTASILKDGFFNPGTIVGGPASTLVSGAVTSALATTFFRTIYYSEGTPGAIKGRAYTDSNRKRVLPFAGPPINLTSSNLGLTELSTGFDVAGDTAGNSLVYFAQGDSRERTAVVAGFDLPPDKPSNLTRWTKSKRPTVSWESDGDAWGPVTYQVFIGGRLVGQTGQLTFTSPTKIQYAKKYKFRVFALDVRGQITRSNTVSLMLDTRTPTADVNFKRHGKRVSVVVKPQDKGSKKRPASGIKEVRINWGDGKTTRASRGSHGYNGGGRKKVRVTITDRAGNSRTIAKRV